MKKVMMFVDIGDAKNWFDGLSQMEKRYARTIIKLYANVINNKD